MATPKIIATFCLLAFYTSICGQTIITTNKIDSLRTEKDVFKFVRQHFQYDGKETFEYYRNETRQVADSLKVRNWVKADIDNNGETDLLVFRADKLPNIFAILSFSNKFKAISAQYSICKYQFMYPVVTTLNNQNVILLHSQDQRDYDRNTKHFVYTSLICDTLLVKDTFFVNYVQAPMYQDIEKIEISNDGICEGNCPRINISIDAKTFSSNCSKELYWDNKPKKFRGQLTKEEITKIISILRYSNFTELNKYYEVGCTDQTTTTLTITYDGGKTKVITDYGSSGNFTLAEIYNIAFGIKWNEEKGSR